MNGALLSALVTRLMSYCKKMAALAVIAGGTGSAWLFYREPPATQAPQVAAEPGFTRRVTVGHGPSNRDWKDTVYGNTGRGKTADPAAPRYLMSETMSDAIKLPAASTARDTGVGGPAGFSPSFRRTFNPAGALLNPVFDAEDAAASGESGEARDESAMARGRTHRIVDGDTLSALATRYLGTSERYREIYDANRHVLTTPDLLPIGAILMIPDRSGPLPTGKVEGGGVSNSPVSNRAVERSDPVDQLVPLSPRGSR